MKISGTASLPAPPARTWTALNDLAVLAAAIPGCDQLAATGPGTCHFTITTAVASTPGTYTGDLRLMQADEPASFLVTATAAGGPGTITATIHAQLTSTPGGATELAYTADATVTGLLAALGQLLLATAATKLASDFFAAIDGVLTGTAPEQGVSEGGAAGVLAGPPPGRGVGGAGAAGVSSPTDARTPGASGLTTELPAEDGQPAGRLRPRPPAGSFLTGVIAGATAALALARLLRRRTR
jgi:carbon monoxide dehydrogenase subunit G